MRGVGRENVLKKALAWRVARLAMVAVFVAPPALAQTSYPRAPVNGGSLPPRGAGVPTEAGPTLSLATLRGGFRELVDAVDRVIGGRPAAHEDWRSFVLIQARVALGRVSTCGGTVIATRWVLTAGHCVVGRDASSFTVIEGVDRLAARGRKIGVDRVALHESYADGPPRNDIALLHLSEPARSPSQALVGRALARRMLQSGTTTMLAGFGLTAIQPISRSTISCGAAPT